MSGGPPSWVDTGGDDDGGASGGYGGGGGGNGSSSSSPWANGDGEFDASSFGAISYTHTDRGEIMRLFHFVRIFKEHVYFKRNM